MQKFHSTGLGMAGCGGGLWMEPEKKQPKRVKCCFVPESRKRPRKKRRSRNPLAVDRMFDGVVNDAFKVAAPKILYHYTSWSGAEGILRSQTFWATAHDCTNDEAELKSADAIVMEVARELRRNAKGAASTVLDLFLDGYPRLQITQLRTVYLTCFSVARDDKEQWRKYADTRKARGVPSSRKTFTESVK